MCPRSPALTQTAAFLLPTPRKTARRNLKLFLQRVHIYIPSSCSVRRHKTRTKSDACARKKKHLHAALYEKWLSMRASFLLSIHAPEEVLVFQQRFLSEELYIIIEIYKYTFIFFRMPNINQTPPAQHGCCHRPEGETDLRLRIVTRSH